MICSTCGTEVDKYYRGWQCKPCFRKPQKAWRQRNREKENVAAQKRYKQDPEKHRRCVCVSKRKRVIHYLVQHRLRDKYNIRKLTDTYIKKLIKRTWSNKNLRIVADQEIKDRRKQVSRFRWKRDIRQIKKEFKEMVAMVVCPFVKKEIPSETCDNMQSHFEKCEGCEHKTRRLQAGIDAQN